MKKIRLDSKCGIGKVADNAANRYALANVVITPMGTDRAALAATDGRVMAVRIEDVETDGETDLGEWSARVPGKTLPAKKCELLLSDAEHERRGTAIRTPAGTLEVNGFDGRMPAFEEVVPPTVSGMMRLTLDAALLARLAAAITRESDGVDLYFEISEKTGSVETAVAVSGDAGFGVLMPMHKEHGSDWAARVAAWKHGWERSRVNDWTPTRYRETVTS